MKSAIRGAVYDTVRASPGAFDGLQKLAEGDGNPARVAILSTGHVVRPSAQFDAASVSTLTSLHALVRVTPELALPMAQSLRGP
jgi:hypothetical protein